MLAVNVLLALACACDLALAAPVRTLGLTRSGDTSVRLGEPGRLTLTAHQPVPPRPARPAPRRLAPQRWRRARRRTPPATAVRVPRRRTPPPHHQPAPHPPRRPPGRSRHRPLLRPARPAARQGPTTSPGRVRVLPPFTSRKHLPVQAGPPARTRRPHQRPHPRRGHGVRQPARIRPRRRHPLHRLAGHRPPADRRRPHLAP